MKRNYELMLVLSPELDENALETLIDRIKRFLDNAQADVLNFKNWGLRRMAYMILGQREGRYYLVHFEGDPENCSELERNLILSEGILRHLLTRAEYIPVDEPVVIDEPVVVDEPVIIDEVADDTVIAESIPEEEETD